jgi:hypothetical protein
MQSSSLLFTITSSFSSKFFTQPFSSENRSLTTAKSTVGYMSNEQRSTHHNNNPWFDNTCKEKRDEFHIVSNRYRFDKSDRTKEELNLKGRFLSS